jgi:RNA polymerase sigma-70 factor (ECF subfamily)
MTFMQSKLYLSQVPCCAGQKEIKQMIASKTTTTAALTSQPMLDEYSLVTQAQQGDEIAFEELYKRYLDKITRYLMRIVGNNDAIGCELAQETFLTAWQSLSSLRDPLHFSSWLYRIATNKAYNHQHRVKLVAMLPWEEYNNSGEDEPGTAGPEGQVEEAELLQAALAHVPIVYRSCLILYVIEEMPQRQIAEILHLKESCVSKYISRGKEALRRSYLQLAGESLLTREGKRN